jgi:hypothetical protein
VAQDAATESNGSVACPIGIPFRVIQAARSERRACNVAAARAQPESALEPKADLTRGKIDFRTCQFRTPVLQQSYYVHVTVAESAMLAKGSDQPLRLKYSEAI